MCEVARLAVPRWDEAVEADAASGDATAREVVSDNEDGNMFLRQLRWGHVSNFMPELSVPGVQVLLDSKPNTLRFDSCKAAREKPG